MSGQSSGPLEERETVINHLNTGTNLTQIFECCSFIVQLSPANIYINEFLCEKYLQILTGKRSLGERERGERRRGRCRLVVTTEGPRSY